MVGGRRGTDTWRFSLLNPHRQKPPSIPEAAMIFLRGQFWPAICFFAFVKMRRRMKIRRRCRPTGMLILGGKPRLLSNGLFATD